MLTVEQIREIAKEAKDAASVAAAKYFEERLGGQDQYACGFAWLNIYSYNGERLKGNTTIGRALKAAGIKQNWERVFQIWNPSGHSCQNVDVKEAGALAAAEVFKRHGFEAYAGSRLD